MKHLAYPNEILSYGKVMEAPGKHQGRSGKVIFSFSASFFSDFFFRFFSDFFSDFSGKVMEG